MHRRLILPIILAFSTTATYFGAAAADDHAAASGRLVLFGAHWCAPCRAEVAILPALVAAAGPAHVVVAWIDRPLALPPGLPPERVTALSPAAAEALAARTGGQGYGLPFTASFADDGRLCTVRRKPLKPEDVAALLIACQRQEPPLSE